MATGRDRAEDIQRTRILRAIAEAVIDREASSVTVADVVARAGVSRRTFYEHFVDREECFRAAFEWGLGRARVSMAEAYAAESRWLDGVRAALAALLILMDQEPALARLCIVRALGGGREVLQLRADALTVLCDFVDRGRLERSTATEPPAVTAEGVVGAVMAVIHTRLLAANLTSSEGPQPTGNPTAAGRIEPPLVDLLGQLMSLIVLPYLGAAAARRELSRPSPVPRTPLTGGDLGAESSNVRLTYRTTRVLLAIAERPGANNREVAGQAGIVDQGQISRLLRRLEGLGLIANTSDGSTRGAPNAWLLTARGEQVERSAHQQARQMSRLARD
jgi:AcrR family transcriptional regulator/DNA-binding MarR family transcriptional regulator